MKRLKINDYQTILYFVWDNNIETVKMFNEYLKITKGDNWTCGNENETLYISEKDGIGTSSSFYKIGEYIIDFGTSFLGLNEKDFDKGDFIEKWQENNFYK